MAPAACLVLWVPPGDLDLSVSRVCLVTVDLVDTLVSQDPPVLRGRLVRRVSLGRRAPPVCRA